ncbi:hypothetical protein D9M72_603610 [compost metagenome]
MGCGYGVAVGRQCLPAAVDEPPVDIALTAAGAKQHVFMIALERQPGPSFLLRPGHDQFDDTATVRAAVDHVAEKDHPAGRRIGFDLPDERPKLRQAAVDIADGKGQMLRADGQSSGTR